MSKTPFAPVKRKGRWAERFAQGRSPPAPSFARSSSPIFTREEARQFCVSGWWGHEEFRGGVAARIQLCWNRLARPFRLFSEQVSKLVGRPVFTHEFARPGNLLDELHGKRKAPASPLHQLAEIRSKEAGRDNVAVVVVPEKDEDGES